MIFIYTAIQVYTVIFVLATLGFLCEERKISKRYLKKSETKE